MQTEGFLDQLHTACASAIESYRTEFPNGPPITTNSLDIDSETAATRDDVQRVFERLVSFYDDLFDVDSTSYRDEWRSKLVYDWGWREHLTHLTSELPISLSLVFIEGRYARSTGHIGVSTGRLAPATAYAFLASELCHAYQDAFSSPTETHQNTHEGFEQAAAVRALEFLAEDLSEVTVARRAARERARVLVQGVIAHGVRNGGLDPATLRELGVTDAEVDELLAHPVRRVCSRIRPRFRWRETAFLPEYDLVASLLLVSETDGVEDAVATAFHGEHAWTSLLDELQAEPSPWLWRQLYA